jgi:hypothetical protein
MQGKFSFAALAIKYDWKAQTSGAPAEAMRTVG